MPYARYTTVGAIVIAFVLAAIVRVMHGVVHRVLDADIVSAENRAA